MADYSGIYSRPEPRKYKPDTYTGEKPVNRHLCVEEIKPQSLTTRYLLSTKPTFNSSNNYMKKQKTSKKATPVPYRTQVYI